MSHPLDRIDGMLLLQADRLTAWNRDRGRADQWRMAEASLDIAIWFIIASFVLRQIEDFSGFMLGFQVIMAWIFTRLRTRERASIARMERDPMGAHRARVGEVQSRHLNVFLVILMTILNIAMRDIGDILFMCGFCCITASLYLKAADPPPPPRRSEALKPIRV